MKHQTVVRSSTTAATKPPEPVNPEGRPSLAARLVGGVVALASCAALAWVVMLLAAQYAYNVSPTAEQPDESALLGYAYRLEALLKRDPTNGEIRNRYASVLGRQRRYKDAIQELKVAQRTLNMQDSLYFLADMYDKQGMIDEAEAIMADCILINPTDPVFNDARLRLLFERIRINKEKKDNEAMRMARVEFGRGAINWAVRAPMDPNAFMFLGNFYIRPLFPLQAYRCFLLGMLPNRPNWPQYTLMITPQKAMATLGQTPDRHYAKPYRGLP